MSSGRAELVLDADVLMNLLATDHLREVLQASLSQGLVCPRTEAEAIYLESRTPGSTRETIDLAPHIAAGTLARISLDRRETATYVQLAVEVDDGEAQVLAVGHQRGLVIATDDRRARRVAIRLGVRVLATPELIIAWAQAGTAQAIEVAQAISDIEARARYRPRATDPSRPAWDALKGP
jgi:predicted nucleic acid-binding protein